MTEQLRRAQVSELIGEGWHLVGAAGEPAFENAWVNHDAAVNATCAFRKVGRKVHLRGLVRAGTVSAAALGAGAIFTLPVGYRPSRNHHFATASNAAFGAARVDSTLEGANAGKVDAIAGSNVWFSLDGISFFAD